MSDSSEKPPLGSYPRDPRWGWMQEGNAFIFPMWDSVDVDSGILRGSNPQAVQEWAPGQDSLATAPRGRSSDILWGDRWSSMPEFGSCSKHPGSDVSQNAFWDVGDSVFVLPRHPAHNNTGANIEEITLLAICQQDPAASGSVLAGKALVQVQDATPTAIASLKQVEEDGIGEPGIEGGFTWKVGDAFTSFALGEAKRPRFQPEVVAGTWKADGFQRLYVNGMLEAERTPASPGGIPPIVLDPRDFWRMGIGGALNGKDLVYFGKIAFAAWFPFAFTHEQVQAWANDPYGFLQPTEFITPPPERFVLRDLDLADAAQDVLVNDNAHDVLVNDNAHDIVLKDTHDLVVNTDANDIHVPESTHDVEG